MTHPCPWGREGIGSRSGTTANHKKSAPPNGGLHLRRAGEREITGLLTRNI